VRPVRIVVDGRMLAWTGIGRYTTHLLAELAELDGSNEYLVLLRREQAATWRPPGANVGAVVAEAPPYSLAEQRLLPGVIRRLAPDLVHFPHFTVPIGCRVPFVVTVHDLTMQRVRNVVGFAPARRLRYEVKFHVGRMVARAAVHRARHVLVPSRWTADQLAAAFGAPPGGMTVTYEAPGVLTARPEPVTGVGGRFVLFVGNAYPHKNLQVVLDALGLLGPGHDDVRLVVAGRPDAFQRALQARVASGPLAARVAFPGAVSDGQLVWLYRHATCFVFPSLSEGFGLPGLEAMAHGLPVAAARASCLPEIYGEAAAWFDPFDPRSLASVLASVLDDPQRRAALVAAGTERVARYSWRATAEQTLDVYRRALA